MKLQEVMRQTIKRQGKSPKTFETYWQWVEDYLQYLKRTNSGEWIHPKECGHDEIEDWLTWLANYRHVAKSSQNTALQSVLYLYREILGITIENVSAMRSQQAKRVREVISVEEVTRLFEQLDGVSLLASQLIYGCGLRKRAFFWNSWFFLGLFRLRGNQTAVISSGQLLFGYRKLANESDILNTFPRP